MSRTDRRRDRIRQEVPIRHLLRDLGYNVHLEGDQEEQFCCDLHGDGRDTKPSARVYPNNTTYCFAEGLARDAVAYVRAKKDLSYIDALKWLETQYKLPPLPFEEGDYAENPANPYPPDKIDPDLTFDGAVTRVRKQLDRFTKEKALSLDALLTFWEEFDRTAHLVKETLLSERDGMKTLLILRERMLRP